MFGGFIRCHHDHPLLAQFSVQARAPVISVSEQPTWGWRGQFRHQMEVVDMGRSQLGGHDHARPSHPQMQTEAIKHLFAHFVIAIGGLPGKAAAAVGAGQAADREGALSTMEMAGSLGSCCRKARHS